MTVARTKKKPAEALVQTRISRDASTLLAAKADAEALTVAAYLRRLLYKHLGVMP